jgi:hypothetical protein
MAYIQSHKEQAWLLLPSIDVAEIEKAASEISRVAKFDVIIGVPYKQDIRVGRSTCVYQLR